MHHIPNQVSQEIVRKVMKYFLQEFSGTENQNLSALFKLGELVLSPQDRAQSTTVQWATQSTNVEKQEQTAYRSQNDHNPEVVASIYWFTHSMNFDAEETSYMVIGAQERLPNWYPGISSMNHRRHALQVSSTSAVKTPLQQLKQTSNSVNLNNT